MKRYKHTHTHTPLQRQLQEILKITQTTFLSIFSLSISLYPRHSPTNYCRHTVHEPNVLCVLIISVSNRRPFPPVSTSSQYDSFPPCTITTCVVVLLNFCRLFSVVYLSEIPNLWTVISLYTTYADYVYANSLPYAGAFARQLF